MAEAKKTKTTKTTEQTAVKEAAPKTAAKKTTVKKTETKAAARKTTSRTKKAAVVKESISIQFAGKEYTTEKLVGIAKDVWELSEGILCDQWYGERKLRYLIGVSE